MSLITGQILQGRYHIASHLGQGGMGVVYQAQDMRLNKRLVAVKEFDPAQLLPNDRPIALRAFQQEARILAGLNHPGLTAVHDYFLENNKFYLVMEFVNGETLQQVWERRGPRFAEAQVVVWTQELCDVLSYLHNQQPAIIFRDLKPGNIMVQPNGRLKLIDFGIARHFTPGKTSDTVKFGTPGYAAPEQYGQGQTDARSDIYALGVVAHQLLTGYDPTQTPFHLPPISQLAPQISPQLSRIVTQALEMDPAKRPLSTGEFSIALQTTTTLTANVPSRKFDVPLWGWGLIAGLLLLMISGGALLWHNSNNPPAGPVIVRETVVVTRRIPPATVTPKPSPATRIVTAAPTVTNVPPQPTVNRTPTVLPTSPPLPTQTPRPTATTTVVTAFRPDLSQTNLTSIWQGIEFEDMQLPGTRRYNTTVFANETRRWSFIWCGRTHADLENIVAPLNFSMLLNGQPISSAQILEHDEVVNGWQCRYWSTLLQNWTSGQTVEVEAYYQLAERIFDGENYYEAGNYRQIITVRVR